MVLVRINTSLSIKGAKFAPFFLAVYECPFGAMLHAATAVSMLLVPQQLESVATYCGSPCVAAAQYVVALDNIYKYFTGYNEIDGAASASALCRPT